MTDGRAILLVCLSRGFGGGEVRVLTMAKALHGRKKGEKVQLRVLLPRPLRLATVDVKLR